MEFLFWIFLPYFSTKNQNENLQNNVRSDSRASRREGLIPKVKKDMSVLLQLLL